MSTTTVPRDGATMDLTLWTPDDPPRAAILLIQEIFGVGPYIRAVGERLADLGYLVGAPELFWRFAPGYEAPNDEAGMQDAMAKAGQLDPALAQADCIAALDALAAMPGITAAPGVLGFCLGGTLAFGVAAAAEPSVCVSYYGSGVPGMLGLLDDVHCPTLFHFGSEDPWIPGEGVEALSAAIAGQPRFQLNVEIAGHAFDNHDRPEFHDEAAAQAAWTKTAAFLTTNLPPG
jgi:carboxymethylenebutenolidase